MRDLVNLNVPGIISHWGLTADHWLKIKDVFKVATEAGLKNLKVSPLIPERLLFVHAAVTHLQANGFMQMQPLIPTLDGQTYFCDFGKAFSLYNWVEGRQCDFKNLPELAAATKVLAKFHLGSSGFTPPPHSNMRDHLGKCLKHFQERRRDLLNFKKEALTLPQDPFAKLFLENIGLFLPMAELAIEKLQSSGYDKLVQQAKQDGRFCHGDPAARNFILNPAGKVFLIDFDSCRLDLPIMDLIKFTRRVMKKYRWEYSVSHLLFNSYQEVIRLNRSELEVIKAVFYFPQKFWRMSIRYFHNHQRHSPERSVSKFRKYLSNQEYLALFQKKFESY